MQLGVQRYQPQNFSNLRGRNSLGGKSDTVIQSVLQKLVASVMFRFIYGRLVFCEIKDTGWLLAVNQNYTCQGYRASLYGVPRYVALVHVSISAADPA